MKSKSDGFQTLQIDLMPLVSNNRASKEKECPEATDPRGAKDSIASGAIGRLDINGLYRIRAELSPIINHQCQCRSHPCGWQLSLCDQVAGD